jgi:hypothetical protein
MTRFDLANHYDCPLGTLGLTASSTEDDIDAAVERELEDIADNYGSLDIASDELRDFLSDWVEREAAIKAIDDIATRIKLASTLRELCDSINEFRDACDEGTDTENAMHSRGVDMCDLPLFGGPEPRDTTNIWSWDEDSLMIADDDGDMKIIDRKES